MLDYRLTSEQGFLTVAYSRTTSRPWGLAGGMAGSCNRAEIHRLDGTIERTTMATGVPVQRGELVRIVTGHGGGHGDPASRDPGAVERDLRDGYITPDEAREDYGLGGSVPGAPE
jgi:N-methylhydantoinase B